MSYNHFATQERVLIEAYTLNGKSVEYIAKRLKRSKSTIHYGLAHISPYAALGVQIDYETRRESCDCKRFILHEEIEHILTHLKLAWSPESIVQRYRKVHGKPFPICVSTIYRYAVLGLFSLSRKLFIRKGKN